MRKSKHNKRKRYPVLRRKGTLPKPKPVDPKVRAKKRLEQALRANERTGNRGDANVSRIKQLRKGTWPLPGEAAS